MNARPSGAASSSRAARPCRNGMPRPATSAGRPVRRSKVISQAPGWRPRKPAAAAAAGPVAPSGASSGIATQAGAAITRSSVASGARRARAKTAPGAARPASRLQMSAKRPRRRVSGGMWCGFSDPKCTRAPVGRQGKVVAFAAMTARGAYRGLLGCLLLSGMSGLIYEVAWVRSLELIFGATTFAVATVLASFMGGLAAGSAAAGVLSPRLERRHPLLLYAAFEILIAVVAILIPPAFRALVPLVQAVSAFSEASFTLFSLVRFLICAAVLLVPTALMGATLPVVSRYASLVAAGAGAGETARRIGILFAVNTAGAVVGCASAGLVFLPALGLRGTQGLAVALNLAAAAGALALARRDPFAVAPGEVAGGEVAGGKSTPDAA